MRRRFLALFLALAMCCALIVPGGAAGEGEAFTRGEFCARLVEALGLTYDEATMAREFTDLAEGDEYYEAAAIAAWWGFMNPFSDGSFQPDNTITRAEVAAVLVRALGRPSGTMTLNDVEKTHWCYNYASAAVELGVMDATNKYFYPNNTTLVSDVDFDRVEELMPVFTADSVTLDLADGSIIIAEKGYLQNDAVTYSKGSCFIRQKDSGTTPTANTVTLDRGSARVTLMGVNIETTAERSHPISVAKNAHLRITLVGTNTVTANGKYAAGIHVPDGASLTVDGSGSIDAMGGISAAGIGGGRGGAGGTITVSGGTVTATGGSYGAGIGGGYNGAGGNITVSGGTVTATSGNYGAGIGGGDDGAGGNITVSGGTVTATGGSNAAGIGGGSSGAGGNITISGGTVTAVCGGSGMYDRAAGIGGGNNGGCGGTVSISNATVTAEGYYHAIGGSKLDNEYGCDSITIGKNVTLDLSYTANNGSLYQERIFDLELPASAAALAGNAPLLETVAYGASGLEYQWQISPDGSAWTDIDGATEDTCDTPITAETDGHYFRCQLTNGFGNVVYTDPAQCYVLAFSKQPTSVEAGAGNMIVLEAQSTCDQVTYRWERSYDDGGSWQDVPGETYATLLLNADLNENNALYRCVNTATNGDELPSEAARITVTTDKPTYTTQYWLQEANGEDYTLAAQTVLEGTAGASVTAPTKTFEGYTENAELGVHSGSVKADSSLILSRYYDRNFYTITFEVNGGSAVAPMEARFGARIKEPSAPSRYGYTFDGWYADEALTEEYEFTTMPMGGTTVYAKWKALDEHRGIEYRFNGITIRDPETYETLNAIPDGNFYAEVSVTNLKSKTTDSLVVASYDKDGRMLDISFLYANPGVGNTVVFGALIQNSGEVASIKAFMLAALNGLRPLAVNAVYPAPDGWYEPQPGEPGAADGLVLALQMLQYDHRTETAKIRCLLADGSREDLAVSGIEGVEDLGGLSGAMSPAFYMASGDEDGNYSLKPVTSAFADAGIHLVKADRETGLNDYVTSWNGEPLDVDGKTSILRVVDEDGERDVLDRDDSGEALEWEAGSGYVVYEEEGTVVWAVLFRGAVQELSDMFGLQYIEAGVLTANEYADLYGSVALAAGKSKIDGVTLNRSTDLTQIGLSYDVYYDGKDVFHMEESGLNTVWENDGAAVMTLNKKLLGFNAAGYEAYVNFDAAYEDVFFSDWRIAYGDPDNLTVIPAGSAITMDDFYAIADIFAYEGDDTLSDGYVVYIGTQEEVDASDSMSFQEFVDGYLDHYEVALTEFYGVGNGDWLKVIDNDGDGYADYVFQTYFEMSRVVTVAKNGDLSLTNDEDKDGIDAPSYGHVFGEYDETLIFDAKDYITSADLTAGDVVLGTYIDGTAYIEPAPSFEGKIDKYTYATETLTIEGEDYQESDICEHTGYFNVVEDAKKKTNYVWFQDFFGYIRAYAIPPAEIGNDFVLLNDAYYEEARSGKIYAVMAYLDGGWKDCDVANNKAGYIDVGDSGSWGRLAVFEGAGETNLALYTEAEDGTLTLASPKAYDYNAKGEKCALVRDYVDLSDTDVTAGQRTFEGTYTKAVGDESFDADTGEVKVQLNSSTVVYYYDHKTESVKVVTGYKNVIACAEELYDICAMYAVATNVDGDMYGDAYWVADVVVIETRLPVESPKDFGLMLAYNEYGARADQFGELECVEQHGMPMGLEVAELDGMDGAAAGGVIPVPAFYEVTVFGDMCSLKSVTSGFSERGIYVITIDRALDLGDYVVVEDGSCLDYTENSIVFDIDVKTGYNSITSRDASGDALALELGERYIVVSDGEGAIAYAVLVDDATEELAYEISGVASSVRKSDLVLLGDAYYEKTRTGSVYAVMAYLNGKWQDCDVADNRAGFIYADNSDSAWGRLAVFEAEGETNLAACTEDEAGVLKLESPKTFGYDELGAEVALVRDYVDLLDRDVVAGQRTFGGVYTAVDGLPCDEGDADDPVMVQTDSSTVVYYYDRKTESVTAVTGYKSVLACSDELFDIIAMYAVCTNVEDAGAAYWVADAIVIETYYPVFPANFGLVLGYNQVSKNVGDFGELDVVDGGALDTLNVADLAAYADGEFNYNADTYGSIVTPYFYLACDVDGTESYLRPVDYGFARYGVYVITVDREIGLDDYIVDGSGRYFNYTADTVICDIDVKTRYNSLTTVDAYNEKLTLELGESYIVVSDGKGGIAYAILVDEDTADLAERILADA